MAMGAKLFTVVCALVSASLVAGHYHFSTVIMDTPTNSVCPPERHLDAVRSQLTNKVSDALASSCGDSRQGWKRIAFLNMTDADQTCPDAWSLYQVGSVRACGRQEGEASCDSVFYQIESYAYTKVCGRVTGYQYASPDAGHHDNYESINEPYLDGVSIMYGDPRQHIWSFYGSIDSYGCCGSDHANNLESLGFIGNNSFCDTGNPSNAPWGNAHFTDHPLWDGINRCAGSTTCCAPHPGPWFTTSLTLPSIYDIELRICGDEHTHNEDTPITLIEIYVK